MPSQLQSRRGLWLMAAASVASAGPSPLNFDFPADATDPVPFSAAVYPDFIEQTANKAALYRPSIDLLDDDVVNAQWQEGPPREELVTLAAYWANEYDWAQTEDEINGNFSHFALTVPNGGASYPHPLSFHFVHERSADADAIPLLLLHGWPSTHLEWSEVISRLVKPAEGSGAQAFHVVAPDLPGFGFSPAPTHSGVAAAELAAALDQVMQKLGYGRYGVVGTDLGWAVALFMGDVVPDSVIGHYADFWTVTPNATDLARYATNQTTDEESAYIASLQAWQTLHYAHGPAHSLAPLGIGQAMTDSPVGFAGWIWHGLHEISDGYVYSLSEVITETLMLFIQGAYGNIRLYREVFGRNFANIPLTKVPTGAGQFGSPDGPFEDYKSFHLVPRDWMERIVNLVYLSRHESGGHFPAKNVPDIWVQDVQEFFGGLVRGDFS